MSFYAYYRAGDQRFAEAFGLDFGDFREGQQFEHRPGMTISQQDNLEHTLDTMNSAMLHFDDAYARHTAWGRPLVVSTLTVQRVIGMAAKTFARRKAILGFEDIALPGPVFGGDTLYATSTILQTNDGGPGDGVVLIETDGRTSEGTVVVRVRYRAAVYRNGHGPDGGLGPPAAEPRFAAYRELGGDRYREQYGLFFEDCRPGETFLHRPRRTFLRDEAIAQAHRAMEDAPRYHDLDWVRRHEGGRLQVSETFVLAAAATTSTRTFGRVSANLGWRNVALPHPVYAGDTVQAESTVTAARPSRSRPGEGVVDVSTRATNQDGVLVLSFDRTLLVYRRGPGGPYDAAGYS